METAMPKQRYTAPSEEQFSQLIKTNAPINPNFQVIQRAVIKAGPRHYKAATVFNIKDPATGNVVRRSLQVNSFPFTVGGGINFGEKNRLARWGCEGDEIERLRLFLNALPETQTPGQHTVIRGPASPTLKQILELIGTQQFDTPQFLSLISALAGRVKELRELPELGETDNLRMVAAALRVAHRSRALAKLQNLISQNAIEEEFQKLLTENWWMLGGQYVAMVPRRDWTVEETVDIMLKRADEYFEIIELKRSYTPLLVQDHGKWIVSGDVNRAVNQAGHYIAEIEANRNNILRKWKIDLFKLKARILVGLIDDNDPAVAAKREALRMYNSHLHRIEVITFDELFRTADYVVHANEGESGRMEDAPPDVGCPF
jgi:hypothetical protein